MKLSMMGSSKYEFDPEQLDIDIASKREVSNKFKKDLEEVIYRAYKYSDGIPMSDDNKRLILLDVHRRFIDR